MMGVEWFLTDMWGRFDAVHSQPSVFKPIVQGGGFPFVQVLRSVRGFFLSLLFLLCGGGV